MKRLYGIGLLLLVLAGIAAFQWKRWPLSLQAKGEVESAGKPATPAEKEKVTSSQSEEPSALENQAILFPKEAWGPAGIEVAAATRKPFETSTRLTGKVTLNEDRLSHIFPLVEGRADEVRVRYGDRVTKGQALVVVQSREIGERMLELYQERLKLDFAKIRREWTAQVTKNTQDMIAAVRRGATVEEIEETLRNRPLGNYRERLMSAYVTRLTSQTHYDRLGPLTESGAVGAKQKVEAEAALKAARAALQALLEQFSQDTIQEARMADQTVTELETSIAVAETSLRILGIDDEALKKIDPAVQREGLSHYSVTAPFNGTVISKDVTLLERVAPERQIMTIADLSTVWITADIYETHLPLLQQAVDKTITFRCDAWPDRKFEAKIFYTGDIVQETTRTVALRATALNPEGLLKPGMFVSITLPGAETSPVLTVPNSALQDYEGKTFLFVQEQPGAFARRDVVLGRRTDEATEIVSGLKEGESVAVAGGFALKSRMLASLLEE